ncbi:MAG: NUDIX domain-containing protein [Minisyncoccia bacterium]|jgi:ADP-ribose pyrophosphatase YjhB (NUDIX family)
MPHIHDKVDFVADVFIVNKNKVLLRKHDKHNMWLSPGGHIELDEDPNQAAIREVKEEVGLDISLIGKAKTYSNPRDGKDLIVPRFMNRHHVIDTHEHISMVYFAKTDSVDIKQGKTEISEEIRWFTKEELDGPKFGISEKIRFYAKTALDELGQ